MEHALVLDKLIRGEPRCQSQRLSALILPSTPSEGTSSTTSLPSRSTSAQEPDAPSTPKTEESTEDQMAMVSSMTLPQWRTEMDLLETSSSDQASLVDWSMIRGSQRRHRKIIRAACSGCQRRGYKVREIHPTVNHVFFVCAFLWAFPFAFLRSHFLNIIQTSKADSYLRFSYFAV